MKLNYWIFIMLVFQLLVNGFSAVGQSSNLRWKKVPITQDTIVVDSLTIYDSSFEVFCGDSKLEKDTYFFNGIQRTFFTNIDCKDSLQLRYRVFDIDFEKPIQVADSSLIYDESSEDKLEDFYFRQETGGVDFFSDEGLKKSGSISRGINVGNAQDLSVNSALNLQLEGKIANDMEILATLTDDNLPIQPDGNTSQLQEFDQVFIQLSGNQYKIIAGDFWLKKPTGYFSNYNKRAQGLFGEYSWGKSGRKWTAKGGGALSKGKFARNTVQGLEGSQGPYRLRGNENESYIIILSGTEQVYVDGKLLERGQNLDYIIDYNTAELTFTPRNQITKDSRIVVEFQYTDQNYARSIFDANIEYEGEKFDFWLNVYSEQDAKNQSLQQQLSDDDKALLSQIGDSLELARINSIDSIGFVDNQVTYKLIDTLGVDSVLVHSVHPDSAFYRAAFTRVGEGKGNYIFDKFTATGRVYKWVAPVGGAPQGDYEPSRLIVTPKRTTLITSGAAYRFHKNWDVTTEFGFSNYDKNTFSPYDNDDNNGFSNRTVITGDVKLGSDSISPWRMKTQMDVEYTSSYFNEIERYRGVEFDRDWNVRGKEYGGQQILANVTGRIENKNHGFFELKGQNFTFGDDYQGNRGQMTMEWKQNGFNASFQGSYLGSQAEGKDNSYLRHRASLSQELGPIKIGFEDDHEMNTFIQGDSLMRTDSYQWYEWKVYLASADSLPNTFQLFYKERYDWKSDSTRLGRAATARSIGAEYDWITNAHSQLTTMASYRTLNISAPELIDQNPDHTFLGRVDYQLNLWKRALSANTFYEVGSGLERKKEFLYVEVNPGQGVYTWNDYNGDGIKDLNEFEIAEYPDEANYIRVFTPTDDYVRTYSNEFNQTLFWRPERLWSNKKGVLRFLSRFSNQARFRVKKKLSDQSFDVYNPFVRDVADTSMISYNSTIRNTLFFNRTNPTFGGDYTFSESGTKTLLANGFDSRNSTFHALSFRWNLLRKFTLHGKGEIGTKESSADYTTGRDFRINYHKVEPEIVYQPGTTFRISLIGRYEEKKNKGGSGGETAYIGDIGVRMKWNQVEKGGVTAEVKMVNINYNGTDNNSLSYEMLESLKPGKNFTWNANYQRNISQNLQITIQYNGRKSEDNKVIHAGGVEIRAYF